MRIISGLARGRKLITPDKSGSIRPTTDRAREALFSIIGDRVHSARVLDLYAGTGALGLEAFSRGAEQVFFVEKHANALNIIKKNCTLCTTGMTNLQGDELVVVQHDLRRGLRFRHPTCDESLNFNLIFLDPPYKNGLAEECLSFLDSSHFVTPDTLIIAEECSSITLPQSFSQLSLMDKRRYGDTEFWFYGAKKH